MDGDSAGVVGVVCTVGTVCGCSFTAVDVAGEVTCVQTASDTPANAAPTIAAPSRALPTPFAT